MLYLISSKYLLIATHYYFSRNINALLNEMFKVLLTTIVGKVNLVLYFNQELLFFSSIIFYLYS